MFNKKILSCGISGKFGFFHTRISIKYGTKICCGLNYKKKGGLILNLPIFSSVIKSIKITKCKISILFIPAIFCKKNILENIFSGIKIIICISENISVFDMLKIKFFCNLYKILFIGANTPGIVLPNKKIRIGIFPLKYLKKGLLGIISRSGTLTYKAIKISSELKIGQSICIGIGGDYILPIDLNLLIKIFLHDNNTKKILFIGEVGGDLENRLCKIKIKKKIIFYIAGLFSPLEKTMGHSGAINSKKNDILKKIKKIKKKFFLLNDLNELFLI